MSQPITDEATKQKLLDLLRRGQITRQAIAERLHCSTATVSKWSVEAGILPREPGRYKIKGEARLIGFDEDGRWVERPMEPGE